ncbi:hypothetical protein PORCRE_1333 [Porphyromonas crevioricanis JCM 15906]|uniref:Uncharacterized protein n=1 Tax=Porphyromonas crevioricanis JCM 15906 TaxID=1305617 RepID=T1CRC7_9PORP|nr:hypothetical protein PORCRE_1333 [Porphyromonas crevioricanis JCM 15906]GAD06514.1 hypothetical protein PORCAN_110 [Porphyromonas crevioricanis JCM 13913]
MVGALKSVIIHLFLHLYISFSLDFPPKLRGFRLLFLSFF